jgi:hypothetical protein
VSALAFAVAVTNTPFTIPVKLIVEPQRRGVVRAYQRADEIVANVTITCSSGDAFHHSTRGLRYF